MSVKIQLNSLEALERLMGGDSEMEIELRNSIAQSFAKKHLKNVISQDFFNESLIAAQNQTRAEFLKKDNYYNGSSMFKKEVLEKIKEDLSKLAKTELSSIVSVVLENHKTSEIIQERINEGLFQISAFLEKSNLERMVERAVERIVREKLAKS